MPEENLLPPYVVMRGDSLMELGRIVSVWMREEGYKPQGGVCFAREPKGDFYLQAMVKP